ncbi:MAG: OmpA family protein [Candidatus Hydrogenedentes bacterium]|nr:OmpA family protein [Candidatus Hydrogenedentota bacterium]
MNRLLVGILTIMLVAGSAAAATCEPKTWDDMFWWGNGAAPEPYPDQGTAGCPESEARSCYWWWPEEPDTNAEDAELWGNRGVVYHCWVKSEEPPLLPPAPASQDSKTLGRQRDIVDYDYNVLFDFDKSILKPEGRAAADNMVKYMKTHPGDTVVVEGHTCDLGSEDYNMTLGQRRADAVKKYMLESGIAPERITTMSLGESQPAVPNDSEPDRKLNRRVQFNVTMGPE